MSDHDAIFSAQCEWIDEHYGPDQAVNLGWGVGEDGVASKIYGEDGGILDSWVENGRVVHDFKPWNKYLRKDYLKEIQ
jgi:hypothetical protein